MHCSITLVFFVAAVTSALQLPNLQPFLSAIPISLSDYIPQLEPNTSAIELEPHENLKRQNSNSCPSSYNNCGNLGATGLCCSRNAVCSADYAGHVACCPTGAACTGSITSVAAGGAGSTVTGSTSSSSGLYGLAGGSTSTTSALQTSTTNGLVLASTQTTGGSGQSASTNSGGFIVDGQSTVATPGAAVRAAELVSAFSPWD